MRIPKYRARIEWVNVGRGGLSQLPTTERMIHPAHFAEDGPTWPASEGWSVVLEFEQPPSEQGPTATGVVSFLVEGAPHERLRPGRRFDYYMGHQKIAVVEVGAPIATGAAGA